MYNVLGYGFLEKVYENALAYELRKSGLVILQQQPITVYYDGIAMGEYFADMLVSDKIIVELKSCEAIHPSHAAQLLNYLKATGIEVGLVLNFGPKPTFKRKVASNRSSKKFNQRKSA